MPELLTNPNCMFHGIDDGKSQPVLTDYWIMPPWALNHFDFIRQNREALEHKYITQRLGHWIDLIFGKYQRDVEKNNVFCEIMYEEYHKPACRQQDLDDNMFMTLSDFYQVPTKLFTEEVQQR